MASRTRYEFRCWGKAFDEQRRLLESDWQLVGEDQRCEVYYLGGNPRFGMKARQGHLEIKEHVADKGRLQLWEPVADILLPLSMDELAPWLEQVFSLTGAATAGDETLDQAAMESLLARQADADILAVEKSRQRFSLAGLLGECTTVRAGGQQLETVAVEGEEAEAVEQGIRLLRLDDCANQSYPARLQLIAGNG